MEVEIVGERRSDGNREMKNLMKVSFPTLFFFFSDSILDPTSRNSKEARIPHSISPIPTLTKKMIDLSIFPSDLVLFFVC